MNELITDFDPEEICSILEPVNITLSDRILDPGNEKETVSNRL